MSRITKHTAASAFGQLDDAYILRAEIPQDESAAGTSAWSRFLHSGWFAACVCAVVGLTVYCTVLGMASGHIGPLGHGRATETTDLLTEVEATCTEVPTDPLTEVEVTNPEIPTEPETAPVESRTESEEIEETEEPGTFLSTGSIGRLYLLGFGANGEAYTEPDLVPDKRVIYKKEAVEDKTVTFAGITSTLTYLETEYWPAWGFEVDYYSGIGAPFGAYLNSTTGEVVGVRRLALELPPSETIPSTEAEYIACAARLLRMYMNLDVEGWAAGVSKSGVSLSDYTVSFDRLVGGLPCRSEVSVTFNSAGQVTQLFAFDSMSDYAGLRLDGERARVYFDMVASREYAPYPYETESRSVYVYLMPIGGELYIVGDTEYSWYEQDEYLFKNGNEYAVKAEGFIY